MQADKYLVESKRTAASGKAVNYGTFPTMSKALHQAVDIMQAGSSADAIKRSLFYADDSSLRKRLMDATNNMRAIYEMLESRSITLSSNETDMLHAILGVASEAGELLEALLNAKLSNRPVDRVNAVEELGDLLWYIAMGLRSVDSNFNEAFTTNINKLRVRYPEKFSTDNAVNRDLEAEKDALSSKKSD